MLMFDTNVLGYAHDSVSKHNQRAARLVTSALKGELKACVSYQSLAELYAVLTHPQKLAKPYSASEASELCGLYVRSRNLAKVLPSKQTYLSALKLAGRTGVNSTKIFDCLLVATALDNGVDTIYTENTKDFKQFESIKIVNPFLEK